MHCRVRNLLLLTFTLLTGVQPLYGQAPQAPPAAPDQAAVEFLLSSAAKDFNNPRSKRPTAVRDARVGYFHDAGKGVYLLCGSVQHEAGGTHWTRFATVKTSDAEHWLGAAAASICDQKSIKWYAADHAAALMQRVGKR